MRFSFMRVQVRIGNLEFKKLKARKGYLGIQKR